MLQQVISATQWFNTKPLIDFIKELNLKIVRHRNYKKTLQELNMLTDKELMDIGINRGMIHTVAREAFYGESV
jgi:uncharacterized protein YjiS (DUF1127 family)